MTEDEPIELVDDDDPSADEEVIVISEEHLAEPEPVDDRIEFERGMSYWPGITLVLIIANCAAFGWEVATDAMANQQAILDAGALERKLVLQGEWWRLFTSMFLHADFNHLWGNMLVLYILGVGCEHAFGAHRALTIYFATGLCGGLMSMMLEPGPAVGASGAVFGMMGALVGMLYRHHKRLHVRDNRIGFVLLIWAAYTIATGFLDPWIANFAHLGGFLSGAAIVLLLHPTRLFASKAEKGELEEKPFGI